jgi:hypothetical protein
MCNKVCSKIYIDYFIKRKTTIGFFGGVSHEYILVLVPVGSSRTTLALWDGVSNGAVGTV